MTKDKEIEMLRWVIEVKNQNLLWISLCMLGLGLSIGWTLGVEFK